MGTAASMLESYPKDVGNIDTTLLASCIEACIDCAQTCTACAHACLGEDAVAELTTCIRTDLDCADLCAATGPNTLTPDWERLGDHQSSVGRLRNSLPGLW